MTLNVAPPTEPLPLCYCKEEVRWNCCCDRQSITIKTSLQLQQMPSGTWLLGFLCSKWDVYIRMALSTWLKSISVHGSVWFPYIRVTQFAHWQPLRTNLLELEVLCQWLLEEIISIIIITSWFFAVSTGTVYVLPIVMRRRGAGLASAKSRLQVKHGNGHDLGAHGTAQVNEL